jgi:hypothetical protein
MTRRRSRRFAQPPRQRTAFANSAARPGSAVALRPEVPLPIVSAWPDSERVLPPGAASSWSSSNVRTIRIAVIPSAKQWCSRSTAAVRLSPSAKMSSDHSGRPRSRRASISAATARSSAASSTTRPPSRTCRSIAKPSSGSQAGGAIPNRDSSSRSRRRGAAARRGSTRARNASASCLPSTTSTLQMCPTTARRSRARMRASSSLSRSTIRTRYIAPGAGGFSIALLSQTISG